MKKYASRDHAMVLMIILTIILVLNAIFARVLNNVQHLWVVEYVKMDILVCIKGKVNMHVKNKHLQYLKLC